MIFWIQTAGRFLTRSKSTSIVLALMVFTAVSTLVFLSSFAVGINDAMIRNSVQLFSGHISGEDLPPTITETQLLTDGVEAVLQRMTVSGILHSKEKSTALAMMAVSPAREKQYTALWKKTMKGRYLQPGKKEIYLSEWTADKLGVAPGDPVMFRFGMLSPPIGLRVAGIFHTGMPQFDRGVSFCPVNALPSLSGPWNAAVFLRQGVDPDDIIARYRRTDALRGLSFFSWSERMPDLRQLIELNYLSMGIVICLVFMVISFGIACAFSIFIIRHMRSYGIMKVMGVTPGEIFFLIFSKVMLVNLAASAAGIMAGAAAVLVLGRIGIDLSAYTSHNQYFVISGIIFPRLTAFSLCLPPASSLLFCIPAVIWPAALVIRKDAADIMRSV